ncbi:MAG: hypothetical protein KatS3mg111_0071 [Pirellulaceae bacterium]|nr:MAG: hypothetical protein KatS3mg111_0071 [Pirellulaceae bacterium]
MGSTATGEKVRTTQPREGERSTRLRRLALATLLAFSGVPVGGISLGDVGDGSTGRSYLATANVQTVVAYGTFQIPFSVRGAQQDIAEVQLWVSNDHGNSWRLHESRHPNEERFSFTAPSDGIYHFSVRTVDARGRAYPSANPPLVIGVDQTNPTVNLAAEVLADGQVQIDIRVVDQFIDLGSARLKLRGSGEQRWHDVLIDLRPVGRGEYRARTVVPAPPGDALAMAFVIKDRAGHEGFTTLQVAVPHTADSGGAPELVHGNRLEANDAGSSPSSSRIPSLPGAIAWRPVGSNPTELARRDRQSGLDGAQEGGASSATDRYVANTGTPGIGRLASGSELSLDPPRRPVDVETVPATPFAHALGTTPSPLAPANRLPSPKETGAMIEELPPPPALEDTPSSPSPQAVGGRFRPTADDSSLDPLLLFDQLAPGAPAADTTASGAYPTSRIDSAVVTSRPARAKVEWSPQPRADGERELSPTDPLATSEGAALAPLGNSPSPRTSSPHDAAFHSRSLIFSLDYDVADLRGSSLASVELWGTEDGGQTWQKWGEDADRRSPFDVQVGNDGLFGFRMVVVSTNGLVSNRPHPGDDADMWIVVDTQPPTARIHRAVYGHGADADKLIIEYSSDDEFLAAQPVTLLFSELREGPWQPLATGLPSHGQYAWKVPADAPTAIFLRIEAADKAGNVGGSRLEVPVELARLAPKGRIKGFRPVLEP